MLPGDVRRRIASIGDQGAESGKRGDNAVPGQCCAMQVIGRLLEQVVDVLFGRHRLFRRPVGVGVGGADQGEVSPGDDEEQPVVLLAREIERLVSLVDSRHQDMRPAGGPQHRFGVVVKGADLVHPGAGHVDNNVRFGGKGAA